MQHEAPDWPKWTIKPASEYKAPEVWEAPKPTEPQSRQEKRQRQRELARLFASWDRTAKREAQERSRIKRAMDKHKKESEATSVCNK